MVAAKMSDMIKQLKTFGKQRLRVRRVNEQAFAESAAAEAQAERRIVIRVIHGGAVANTYGYRAETEAALVVALPSGHAALWCARLPANKVTYRGAAEACLAGTGDIFDGRTGKARTAEATGIATIAAARATGRFDDLSDGLRREVIVQELAS